MSWILVLALAGGAYSCKALGLLVLGGRSIPRRLDRCLALIPAALVAALIAKDTLTIGQSIVLDARAAGVSAAVVAAWRRLPLIVVIVVGAAVTAGVRALG